MQNEKLCVGSRVNKKLLDELGFEFLEEKGETKYYHQFGDEIEVIIGVISVGEPTIIQDRKFQRMPTFKNQLFNIVQYKEVSRSHYYGSFRETYPYEDGINY